MRVSASNDMATSGDASAGSSTAAVSGTRDAASAHRRLVAVYLLLAALLLTPGAYLKLAPAAPPSLVPLASMLSDIRFGSGARFWLGVAGATAMTGLLLYPLRKVLSRKAWAGSIATWFHLHMVAGILAPVAIVYHAGFGFGGTNANVALVAMLVVVVSGLAGVFAYGGASRKFHGTGRTARQNRDYILGRIAMNSAADTLSASFDAFEAICLAPRRGIIAALAGRRRVEGASQELWRDIARLLPLLTVEHQAEVTAATANYLRLARRAAARAVVEQTWAWWRRFHLPVYLVMLVATALHIEAVWNMDDGRSEAELRPSQSSAPSQRPSQAPRAETTPVLKIPPAAVNRTRVAASAEAAPSTSAKRPVELSGGANASAAPLPAVAAVPTPLPAPKPTPAARPAPMVLSQKTAQQTAPNGTSKDSGAMKEVYTELQRRPVAPPMGLGRKLPGSLAEQIAAFKEKRAAGTFNHHIEETGFDLTGKHVKVECATCHTKPLTGEPSVSPRACVDCHRKDDVHKGRRPDCAQCHTANRWTQILRRR